MNSETWKTRNIGDLMNLEYGTGLTETTRSGSGFPVYGSNGIVGYHNSYSVIGPGIIVGRKGSVGAAHWSNSSFWPIDTAYYVTLTKENDLRWCYWALQYAALQRLDSSTGVPGLNRNDVYKLKIQEPPYPEQIQIAQILDTVDETIQRTEQLIAKLKAIKQGLLHDLLTRGLDENGQLRDPIAHPDQFQDSPLGRIPKEWHLRTIDEIKANSPHALAMGPFGSNIAVSNYTHDGIPVIRGINLSGLIIDFSKVAFISDRKADELISSNIVWNDIVLTHRGTIGQVSLFKENSGYDRAVISQSQLKLTCNREVANPFFVSIYFNSSFGQRLITLAKAHTGVQAIGQPLSTIKGMKIPLPSLDEQRRIETVFTHADGRIEREEEFRNKLLQIKKGLMHDLLTGRVRVNTKFEKS